MSGSRWSCRSLAFAGALAIGSLAYGDVIYVDDAAAPGGDGLTWDTAHRFLQDGLAAALPGDEIRVAQGLYRPDRDEANPLGTGNRDATFVLVNGVTWMGGFAGIGAPDPDERDVDLYVALLSGDLTGNDGPDPFQNYEENSYHVVTGNNNDATAIIDGFTITAGRADGGGFRKSGGGMFSRSSGPTLNDCVFLANWAKTGGGLYLTGTDLVPNLAATDFIGNFAETLGGGLWTSTDALIDGCRFEANHAPQGGGVCVTAAPTFDACEFLANEAFQGGGMYASSASPILTGTRFDGNIVTALEEQSTGQGGGLFATASDVTIIDGEFIGNQAIGTAYLWTGLGAGMFDINGTPRIVGTHFKENEVFGHVDGFVTGVGGGLYLRGGEQEILDCTFEANVASGPGGSTGYGAGMSSYGSTWVMRRCLFVDNVASSEASDDWAGGGGGLWSDTGSATVISCTFARNVADGVRGMGGGAGFGQDTTAIVINSVFHDNEARRGAGFALAGWTYEPTAELINCTFSDNEADGDGGAIFVNGGYMLGTLFAKNSIIWGNTPNEIGTVGSVLVDVQFSDVKDGWGGKGNIDADPRFVDAANGDYALLAESTCTDAAANNALPADVLDLDEDGDRTERLPLDRDGQLRFADNPAMADAGCGLPVVVDMGAYELHGEPVHPVLVGDVDGDGAVGFADLLEVLSNWGACTGECCLADVDFNEEVDFTDLLIVLANWS